MTAPETLLFGAQWKGRFAPSVRKEMNGGNPPMFFLGKGVLPRAPPRIQSGRLIPLFRCLTPKGPGTPGTAQRPPAWRPFPTQGGPPWVYPGKGGKCFQSLPEKGRAEQFPNRLLFLGPFPVPKWARPAPKGVWAKFRNGPFPPFPFGGGR